MNYVIKFDENYCCGVEDNEIILTNYQSEAEQFSSKQEANAAIHKRHGLLTSDGLTHFSIRPVRVGTKRIVKIKPNSKRFIASFSH